MFLENLSQKIKNNLLGAWSHINANATVILYRRSIYVSGVMCDEKNRKRLRNIFKKNTPVVKVFLRFKLPENVFLRMHHTPVGASVAHARVVVEVGGFKFAACINRLWRLVGRSPAREHARASSHHRQKPPPCSTGGSITNCLRAHPLHPLQSRWSNAAPSGCSCVRAGAEFFWVFGV